MSAPDSAAAQPVIAIVGATATGKSDLGVALAERLGGEVINADAMQLYRGMDIGTAKITASERRGIPHHLLDVLDVTEEASVAEVQARGRALIAEIRERGRVPIIVGGSGLYVRAMLDRIEFPPTDPAVRAELEERARREGTGVLYAELLGTDPEAARNIASGDERRIVRALEVGRLTGRSFRSFMPAREHVDPATIQIGIARSRAVLHERVEARVHRMVEQGLLEETRRLREQGLDDDRTARRAIGYEQACAVLDGAMTCDEAIGSTIGGTRRLVRKQDTWFRRDDRVRWLDADAHEPEALVGAALALLPADVTAARERRIATLER